MFNLRNNLLFFFISFLIALMVEFLFRFIATDNPKAFGFAILFYPIFFIFARITGKIIMDRLSKISRILSYTTYYFISGLVGLLIFEWVLAGNNPLENPNSNQFAMFSYWAILGFIPKIFTERKDKTVIKSSLIIKKLIIIHLFTYMIISLVGGFISPIGFPRFSWIIWSFVISFPLMNFYVLWFMIKIRKNYSNHY